MVLETFPPISELATHSIDQAVVDGLVDGVERRIPVGRLLRLSAVVEELPRSVFFGFCQALTDEERYVDRVRNMYGFKPVISPESTVKASLIAIVGGTALCSETERSEALGLMEYLTQTLYNVNTKPSSILSIREVSGTLKSGGFTNLS